MQTGERGTSLRMWLSCSCAVLVLLGAGSLSCCSSGPPASCFRALLSFPKPGIRPALCWAQHSCPTPTCRRLQCGTDAGRARRRSVWHGAGDILAQKLVNQRCSEMWYSSCPGTGGSIPALCRAWGRTGSPWTTSQATQTRTPALVIATFAFPWEGPPICMFSCFLVPCFYSRLSNPRVLTPTALSVGHTGAMLGAGVSLHSKPLQWDGAHHLSEGWSGTCSSAGRDGRRTGPEEEGASAVQW